MKNKLASIILLVYKRPEFLTECLNSLFSVDAGYPYELIIHNDGSNRGEIELILSAFAKHRASYILTNCGNNRGIENAVRCGIGVSSGDYLFKVDADCVFKEGWLKPAIERLEDNKVGAVALIDYRRYDPKDIRFHNITEKDGYLESDNFVSSAYGFTRDIFNVWGCCMKHDGWHKELYRRGYKLNIVDTIDNIGYGRSVYVGKDGKAIKMINKPKIIT